MNPRLAFHICALTFFMLLISGSSRSPSSKAKIKPAPRKQASNVNERTLVKFCTANPLTTVILLIILVSIVFWWQPDDIDGVEEISEKEISSKKEKSTSDLGRNSTAHQMPSPLPKVKKVGFNDQKKNS